MKPIEMGLPELHAAGDGYWAGFVEGVGTKAGPRIVLRLVDKATMDGISMDVLQFLQHLVVLGDIEVVVAGEPERLLGKLVRNRSLDDCQRRR